MTAATARSDVSADIPVPAPPFLGTSVIKGIPLAEYAAYLDERATFMGQWGLKPSREAGGASYEELVETEGRPRLRMWLERAQTEGLLQAAVVYGYFRCVSDGNDLIVLDERGRRAGAVHLPPAASRRAAVPGRLLPARGLGSRPTWWRSSSPPWARASPAATAELFAKNAYREYLELHGLSVQLTEALAEYWHARVRESSASRRGPGRPGRLLPASTTAARATRSAIPPARTWPTGPRSPACSARPDRRRAVRGDAAAPRAVHRRHRRPPPRGQVLQRMSHSGPAAVAVLFDMDGLLIDSEPLWLEAEKAVMARLGGRWDEQDQAALVGGSLALTVRTLLAKAPRPAPPELVGQWVMSDITERVRGGGVPVRPGAWELLAEVAAAGLPRALVTSSQRGFMQAVLDSTGMRFDALVCGQDVTATKPDPEPYLLAAKLIGVPPGDCFALEDSPNGVAVGGGGRVPGDRRAVAAALAARPGPDRGALAARPDRRAQRCLSPGRGAREDPGFAPRDNTG